MTQAELNHLRRLVAWVRCEIGQGPEEMVATLGDIADKLGRPEISDEAKHRLVEGYDHATSVPKYVRAAVASLSKYLTDQGPVVDAAEAPRKLARKQSEAA